MDRKKLELKEKIIILFDQKDYRKCIENIKELYSMLHKNDLKERKFCCMRMSKCHRHLYEYVAAEHWANEAAKVIPTPGEIYDVYWQLAMIYKDSGEYDSAIQLFQDCEDYYLLEQRFKEVAGIYIDKAYMEIKKGNLELAADYYDLSYKFYTMDDSTSVALYDNLIDNIYNLAIHTVNYRKELNRKTVERALEYINKHSEYSKRNEYKKQLKGGE